MRLDCIEVCGFRGFRDLVRIKFGRGFTVITGRNGVGKSTLCDAVEFAITGSIDKYAVEKAAKESLSDYLWWRGEGVPEAHYVTASFVDDDGKPFTITRTRESGADRSAEEIHAALCRAPAPDDALRQLTRTSIIRDECRRANLCTQDGKVALTLRSDPAAGGAGIGFEQSRKVGAGWE